MNTTFIEYPKCTTCKKAKTWLAGQGVHFGYSMNVVFMVTL